MTGTLLDNFIEVWSGVWLSKDQILVIKTENKETGGVIPNRIALVLKTPIEGKDIMVIDGNDAENFWRLYALGGWTSE